MINLGEGKVMEGELRVERLFNGAFGRKISFDNYDNLKAEQARSTVISVKNVMNGGSTMSQPQKNRNTFYKISQNVSIE